MALLMVLGVWLVLQPTLDRTGFDHMVRIGAVEILVRESPGGYTIVSPERLASLGEISESRYRDLLREETRAWRARPVLERTLLGLFNITSWWNLAWIGVGLGGQCAFFGRMLVQWLVSERARRSVVPAAFWWMSLAGGVLLFTYFVWRVDFVGVLGQSTGIVIYARNLRLIIKQRRRDARLASGA